MPVNKIVRDAHNKVGRTVEGIFPCPGKTWVRYPDGVLRLVSTDSLLLL